ncbi:hypothetical protein AB0G67_10890 [Streptomyces sp. NPDC021056]|uniref:hypothetical protein n=1 Tax=Streptomyces sp. NPDC021056 TaxID=3155012 RepID=UPI00340AA295
MERFHGEDLAVDAGAVAVVVDGVVGYALAEEQLRQGLTVVAESVNPPAVTRDAWREAAARARVGVVEVEVRCSDPVEHRRRAASRSVDVLRLPLPG